MEIITHDDLKRAVIMDLSRRSLSQMEDAAQAYDQLLGSTLHEEALFEMEEAAYDARQRENDMVFIDPNLANEIHEVLEQLAYFEVYGLDFSCRELQNLEQEFQRQLERSDRYEDLPEDIKQMLLEDELGWEFGTDEERPASQS